MVKFENLDPGTYSVLLIHDENGNGKLDKMMAMPREGFAFSRNPALRMGPPRYQDVFVSVPKGASEQRLHVKYLL